MATPTYDAVVVGVGGSEEDLQVVRTAAREAAVHDRLLHLLHAFNWTAALREPSVAGSRVAAEHLLQRAEQAATEVEPTIPVRGEIVEGAPVEALLRAAESAYLVALGDGGIASCPTCVPSDAPAIQVAARAGCPVLVGRAEPPPQGPVLVGVDSSPSGDAALGYAFDCAERRGARLLAIRVVEPGRPDHNGDPLAEAVARHAARHPTVAVECHTLPGDPGGVLVEQSRSAQLAVVGARGEDPLRGMLGEVSQKLLYHSPAPVIVVRGLGAEGVERP
ncbi:universal stress protein [Micromonospora sp. SL1-18]|uniref:universal stress protein n=1 Tax=Micromonospora sp. SL1-18 TaxID=3399128 RepID=UPI003A4D8168